MVSVTLSTRRLNRMALARAQRIISLHESTDERLWEQSERMRMGTRPRRRKSYKVPGGKVLHYVATLTVSVRADKVEQVTSADEVLRHYNGERFTP